MFVFGGEKRNTVTNSYDLFDDAFLYNKATDTWTSASAAPLSARRDVGMVWTGSEIIVWGGKSATATEKDGAKYDPITDIWTTINTANAPTLSVGFSSVWTGSKLLVWGKKNGTNVNAGGIYDLALDQWTLMSEVGQPTIERTNHTAVWTGSKMLIWGGASPGSENFVSIFDPSTNSWSQISGQFAPPARVSDAAVWTGTDLIVWGGIYGGKWLNAGGMLRFP
jgi:N-acetylneuraminic acid mutarotase